MARLIHRIFLIFFLVNIFTNVSGQSFQGHQLKLNLGIRQHSELDKLASSLIYDGTFVPLQISYRHQKGQRSHQLEGLYMNGSLSNIHNQNKRSYNFFELSYTYQNSLAKLKIGNEDFLLDWGVGWINRGSHIRQEINNILLPDNGFFYSSAIFLITTTYWFHNRHNIQHRLDLPLAVFLTRPTYSFTGRFDNGKLYPGYQLQHLGNQLAYHYLFTNRFAMGFNADFNYSQLGDINRYRSVDWSFQLTTTFKL